MPSFRGPLILERPGQRPLVDPLTHGCLISPALISPTHASIHTSGRPLTWIPLCLLAAPDLGIHQVVISRIHCGRGDDSSLQPRAHVLDSSKLLSSSSVSDMVPGVSFSS